MLHLKKTATPCTNDGIPFRAYFAFLLLLPSRFKFRYKKRKCVQFQQLMMLVHSSQESVKQ